MKKFFAIILAIMITTSVFYACDLLPQKYRLEGAWRDSNGVSGYEFYGDGTVKITYIDVVIPILNIPFNGTINGTYTTTKSDDNDFVTITFTLFNQSISKTYKYHVDKSVLTLTDPDNNNQIVYMKYDVAETTSQTKMSNKTN